MRNKNFTSSKEKLIKTLILFLHLFCLMIGHAFELLSKNLCLEKKHFTKIWVNLGAFGQKIIKRWIYDFLVGGRIRTF